MKRAALLFLLAGTALAAVLIARSEFADIAHAFATLGVQGLLLVVGLHLCLIGVMGLAWGVLGDPPILRFIWARLLRDGASEVLPLSQIGGFVLGARALVLAGAATAFASASTVVDVTLELVAQLFYTMLGLALLAWLQPGSNIETPALAAVAAMAVLAALFVLAQQRGIGAVERALAGLTGLLLGSARPEGGSGPTPEGGSGPTPEGGSGPTPEGGSGLRPAIAAIHRRRTRLIAGTALHLCAWVLVGGETWLILHLIQAPVSLAAALVIDSLLSGLRSMAFMVPQALGVQEGGYVLLGALFGVAPEAALALSLIRRARDLAIGAPALLAWQIIEGRRALS